MKYSFNKQPYQPRTSSCLNPTKFASAHLQSPCFSSSSLFSQNLNPTINLSISNPADLNSIINYTQFNPLAFIQQQQQLENLLMNQERFLQNQIQNIRLLEQILNINRLNSYNKSIDSEMTVPFFSHHKDSYGIKEGFDSGFSEDSISEINKDIFEVKEEAPTSNLRDQIEEMVTFFLKEFGKASSSKMRTQRNTYSHSKILLEVFDALASKYSSSGKCKEDMTRFVLRKAVSYLRNLQRDKNGYSCKVASLALCKKYFANRLNDIAESANLESEEDVLNFLLPYKKNSRNKTANTCFITEIFASEAFYQDYGLFLENFDEIFERENQKKFKKFVDFILECMKQKKTGGIKTFKRLPWLKTWLSATKVIAEELRNTSDWKEKGKAPNGSKTKKMKV